jgi:phospholipid/cholesterol/gamma-HCH transport system permease protein
LAGTEPMLDPAPGGDRQQYRASGRWTLEHAASLERFVENPPLMTVVDIGAIEQLDTFGAWTIERLARHARAADRDLRIADVPERYQGVLDELHEVLRTPPKAAPQPNRLLAEFDRLGRSVINAVVDLGTFLAMAGSAALALARAVGQPHRLRLTSVVHHLDRVGWQAIGIILLITFLIGAIIAQQGIFNFRRFGAEDYAVNLVGILILREIGVLIVAIMVAGRSGSAYTAELGAMKMREEVDALRAMGIDPVEILVLPRILALIVALPILTFLGSMAALLGGELVTWVYGGMSPTIYLTRLQDAVSLHDFYIGMIKAPVMALLIGIVACSEGLKVKGSAESLGTQTTASVVKSIFLVIVLDGLFAVFFASIGW